MLAIEREAVAEWEKSVFLKPSGYRFCDCCAADRRQASTCRESWQRTSKGSFFNFKQQEFACFLQSAYIAEFRSMD